MPSVPLPCVSPDHASRSGEPDWTEHTASSRVFPEGHTPTPQELTAGGLCLACARLDAPPPEDP